MIKPAIGEAGGDHEGRVDQAETLLEIRDVLVGILDDPVFRQGVACLVGDRIEIADDGAWLEAGGNAGVRAAVSSDEVRRKCHGCRDVRDMRTAGSNKRHAGVGLDLVKCHVNSTLAQTRFRSSVFRILARRCLGEFAEDDLLGTLKPGQPGACVFE